MRKLILTQFMFTMLCCALCVQQPLRAADLRCGVTLPMGLTREAASAFFAHAKALGFKQVRVRAEWPRIQAQAGHWEFTWLDQCIQDARQAGFTITLVFGPAPAWTVPYLSASEVAALARAVPDLPAYQQYVTAVAKRYQTSVAFFQVWERPSVTCLLATPQDVYELFRTAVKAVHRVNPLLQVILPEPGDVNIFWIDGYYKHAQGLELPDILQLSPIQFTLRPQVFWWRVPALCKHVFTTHRAPKLCSEIQLRKSTPEVAFAAATTSLLENIPTTIFTIASPADLDAPEIAAGLQTIASLQGSTYTGWTLLAIDTPAGIFHQGTTSIALVFPLTDSQLLCEPAAHPVSASSIAVPAGTVTVTRLGGVSQTVPVTGKTVITLPSHPTHLSGLAVSPIAGTPEINLPEITGSEVSLDLSGNDPAGLHLVSDLSGGQYSQKNIEGRIITSTIKEIAPWIHVKVPDNFLFFNPAHLPIDVTVDVLGAEKSEACGFNLYYDALNDMRFSNWQWIEVGKEHVFSYTFRLNDALFVSRSGYDFRLCMGGSSESVRVVDIRVRKIEKPAQ